MGERTKAQRGRTTQAYMPGCLLFGVFCCALCLHGEGGSCGGNAAIPPATTTVPDTNGQRTPVHVLVRARQGAPRHVPPAHWSRGMQP